MSARCRCRGCRQSFAIEDIDWVFVLAGPLRAMSIGWLRLCSACAEYARVRERFAYRRAPEELKA